MRRTTRQLACLPALILLPICLRAETPTATEINAALGLPLFPESSSLWETSAEETARRLGWPEESRTSASSSYRVYPPKA